MNLITFGGATRVHKAIANRAASPDARVLEIGCGTGAVTARLAGAGARVIAIDQNPDMLQIAHHRIAEARRNLVEWREMTASEIDSFAADSFDSVVASFSLSEMAPQERAFVMNHTMRVLRPGGMMIVGDEVVPAHAWQRVITTVLRLPQLVLAWILAGTWSTPISKLRDELDQAGFSIESENRWRLGTLAVVFGRKPSPETG
jgi:ubiquinone/menaquinone biosynthesis C-methylase UbiE